MSTLDPFLIIIFLIITYFILLILLKKLNFGRKTTCSRCENCCPDCQDPLERTKRVKKDYIINYLTFQMFDFKRYTCTNCAWLGLRWDKPFSGRF